MTEGHTERLGAALAGRYRIESKLGEGGMASVYLAEDLKHERKVALKILRPELAAVIGAERFLSEIKTTANLQHPHILPLFDSGEAGGYLYYVMPYIDGETLRDKLDSEKQLGVEESVRIARDVADALDYAHRAGVIHRDIKPGNILLHDGRPVVADFGIALAVSAAGGGRMTETGLSLGTPHYMSPEQASADRDLSARSDVYSLGCVLYEMIAGQPPHTGPSAQSILVHILTEDPKPLAALRHTVPANVAAAVAKSIEKLPADRFDSARQFRDALEDAGFSYAATTRPAKAAVGAASTDLVGLDGVGRRWKAIAVAASSLAAGFALALAWSLAQPEPSAGPLVQVLSTDGWAGLDREIGRVAALAPDGSSMVLPLQDGTLGVKLATSADMVPIPGTEGARDVVYAPDGQSILYAAGTEIFRRPLFGGAAIRLLEDAEGGDQRVGMAWLDDGTALLERVAGLVHLSENGGEPLGTVEGLGGLYWLEALPGGRGALAVAAGPRLHVVDLEDYSTAQLLDDVLRAWYAPTGHLVYVRRDGAVFAQPFDLDALELSGGAIPLFEGVRMSDFHADMRLTRDGWLLYVEGSFVASGSGHRLVVVDLEGNRQVLPLPARPIGSVNWSPDGESVAFQSQAQIYTYNTVLNNTPREITFEGLAGTPIFSPDGSRLAFFYLPVLPDETGIDLYVKELANEAPPRPLALLDGQQVPMQWPSDTLIAYIQGSDRFDLWTLDLSDPDAPEARPYLTSEATLAPIGVSPDGTLAAYGSDETGIPEVYIRSFPVAGERTVVSRGGGMGGSWSPDGSTLYYDASADRSGSVVTMVAARLRRDPVLTVVSTDTLFTVEGVPERYSVEPLNPDGDRFIFPVAVEGGSGAEARGARLILVQNWFEELRARVGDN